MAIPGGVTSTVPVPLEKRDFLKFLGAGATDKDGNLLLSFPDGTSPEAMERARQVGIKADEFIRNNPEAAAKISLQMAELHKSGREPMQSGSQFMQFVDGARKNLDYNDWGALIKQAFTPVKPVKAGNKCGAASEFYEQDANGVWKLKAEPYNVPEGTQLGDFIHNKVPRLAEVVAKT